MPVSKKQQAAVSRYVAANYDQILIRVKKGEKAKIEAAAGKKSVNAYIQEAIAAKMPKIPNGAKNPISGIWRFSCPNCSYPIHLDEKYCVECGQSLVWDAEAIREKMEREGK